MGLHQLLVRLPPVVTALVIAGAACTASVMVPPEADGGGLSRVTIHGRVFDMESCPSDLGCQVVVGAVVSLHERPEVLSPVTGEDGAFALSGVSPEASHLLLAESTTGLQGKFVSTLNANPVETNGQDVFGVELYMLSAAEDDLLGAIAEESSRDLRETGGYVGLVLQEAPQPEAVENAHVEVFPDLFPMRYVNVIPRYVPGEPVLLDPTAGSTSTFGLFAVGALPYEESLGIQVTAPELSFEAMLLPMAPQVVAFGIHHGEPGTIVPADAGVDAGRVATDAVASD